MMDDRLNVCQCIALEILVRFCPLHLFSVNHRHATTHDPIKDIPTPVLYYSED
jgi:hypothetical protein